MMMKNFTSKIVLVLATLLGSMTSVVKACSCVAGLTFEERIDQSQNLNAMYVFGEVNVDTVNGAFLGFVDPTAPVDINAPKYFLAYNWKSWKSCSDNNGSYEFLRTGGNSAACGVNLTPGWYALASFDDLPNPLAQIDTKIVGSCDINIPWSSLTYDQYVTLENILDTPCPGP